MPDVMTAPAEAPPQAIFMQHLSGFWTSMAISAAARLGLADQLAKGPATPAEVASALGLDADHTMRLLRALASVGYGASAGDGRYATTPLLDVLRSDAPGSMRNMAIMMGLKAHWQGWGALSQAVKEGGSGADRALGKPFFDYLADEPEEARAFHGAMSDLSNGVAHPIAAAFDFGQFTRLADLGGGHGTLLAAILAAHPRLQGVLFDLPATVTGLGDQPRMAIAGGDFFAGVPSGCDAYVMKHILHDWDDARCVTILTHCANALAAGGKVLVVEMLIQPGDGFDMARWMDLNMLAMTPGGRERTADDFAALFAKAGLQFVAAHPVPHTGYALIEAVK